MSPDNSRPDDVLLAVLRRDGLPRNVDYRDSTVLVQRKDRNMENHPETVNRSHEKAWLSFGVKNKKLVRTERQSSESGRSSQDLMDFGRSFRINALFLDASGRRAQRCEFRRGIRGRVRLGDSSTGVHYSSRSVSRLVGWSAGRPVGLTGAAY